MSKKLILMRHAESPFEFHKSDRERVLSLAGEGQAKAMGRYLRQKNLLPDVMIVSNAQRTMRTAALLAEAAGIPHELIRSEAALYNASANRIEEILGDAAFSETIQIVLVLAHNPGISNFATKCSGYTKNFSFVPAAMAGFEWKGKAGWNGFSSQNAIFSFYQEPDMGA